MEPDEYIWYSDDKNHIYSAGYPINNLFKGLDIPAIKGSCHPLKGDENQFANLAIPAGLVYMHNTLMEPFLEEQTSMEEIDTEPTSEDLYSKLLSLVELKSGKSKKDKTKKKKKKYQKRKKKSRKNN